MSENWVEEPKPEPLFGGELTFTARHTTIEHLNGVPWFDAPLPRRWHRCKPQTRGWVVLSQTVRCACGGMRHNGSPWMARNERRRKS